SRALLYALIRSRCFRATDGRDKVYALLGLVEAYARDLEELRPCYAADHSVEKTYINVAVRILRDSDDLLILSCVEGRRFQRTSLPSWVPDWGCELQTGLRVTGYERYSASGRLPMSRPRLNIPRLTLTVYGVQIDEIVMVGEVTGAVLHGEPFPRWLDIFDAMQDNYPGPGSGEDKLDAFWRTLIANTFKSTGEMIPSTTTLVPALYEWLEMSVPDDKETAERKDWADRVSRTLVALSGQFGGVDYGHQMSHARHLRLFLTREGFIGRGTECLETGDIVCIVPGSRVPLVLRSITAEEASLHGLSEDNAYSLVGGTYLHGFMAGEAFDPSLMGGLIKGTRCEMEGFVLV
ncbi:hypothetical protein QBC47DRAFT_311599, partial [Echria macrotheca]